MKIEKTLQKTHLVKSTLSASTTPTVDGSIVSLYFINTVRYNRVEIIKIRMSSVQYSHKSKRYLDVGINTLIIK